MQISKQGAFTLIELLIVIVIIGILASSLITKVKGVQAKSRDMARIAHMRQMQQALELYYNDYGKYPGAGHFATHNTGCGHQLNPSLRTGVFNAQFQQSYLSSLPVDPKGPSPEYCYGYTRYDTTSHYCTRKDGTRIDVDGRDASGNITGPEGNYVLTFRAETDLSDLFPIRWPWSAAAENRYCLLPGGG